MKARSAQETRLLEQVPNIGPSIANDLRLIGITMASQLANQDPYALYEAINRASGTRHDPCLCDCLIAAVRFMEGSKPVPWWEYTAERKHHFNAESSAGAPSIHLHRGTGR